jgi:hypothetical protein
MIVEIREEARGDLHVGYRFYEEQAAGLGRYFLECIFADIDALRQFAGRQSRLLPRPAAERVINSDGEQ